MIRVLTLSTLFPDSSRPRFGPFVERQTLGLAAHPDVELCVVAPIGFPPRPVSRSGRYAALSALPARENWKGLDVMRPHFLHLPATGGRFDSATLARALLPKLGKLRAQFAFDVIDAEFFFPDGPAAIRLGRALGVPVSIKARGSDIHYWGRKPAIRNQLVSAARSADGLLAVSAALKADMAAMGIAAERVRVHRTGVDLGIFQPVERAQAKAALGISGSLVVSVGTVGTRKGQRLLIDALISLPGVTLVLIGDGPDRKVLERQAETRGVADRVRFTGSLDQANVAHWLGASDAMALPSVSEGLANVWLEALACGTPIVITDVGGACEVVDSPIAGHLVPADPQFIAGAIRELIANPRDPHTVRKLVERFTWEANTDALYAHLASLI
jgi:glycosyltransferase involved in cell wall biosynthesis